jgi:hypothetical protein
MPPSADHIRTSGNEMVALGAKLCGPVPIVSFLRTSN